MTQRYFVSKASGTVADAFLATGFASLIEALFPEQGEIALRDRGSVYEIELPAPIQTQMLQPPPRLLEPLVTETQKAKRGTFAGFNLDRQQQIAADYYTRIQHLPQTDRHPAAIRAWRLQSADIELPHPLLSHYLAILVFQATDTLNEVVLRWANLSLQQQQWHVQQLLHLFEAPFQDVTQIDQCIATWKKYAREEGITVNPEVTALQLINPAQGKGANSTKANRLSIGPMKSFWLLELLKFLGFLCCALSYEVSDKTQDHKVYAPCPTDMTLRQLKAVVQELRDLCWATTAIKLDIQILQQTALFFGRNPLQGGQLSGLDVTHYKYMGKAHIVLNMAFLGIPQWINRLQLPQEFDYACDLIKNQQAIVRGLDEGRGEERQILHSYRNFLSGNDISAFLEFAAAYGPWLMRKRDRHPEQFFRQIGTSDLHHIVQFYDKGYLQSSTPG